MNPLKLLNIVFSEFDCWVRFLFVRSVPGRLGFLIRRLYWKKRFKRSSNFIIYPYCEIDSPENIILGDGCVIFEGCRLAAQSGGSIEIGDGCVFNSNVGINAAENGAITIGKNVIIGPNATLRASNHACADRDRYIKDQGHIGGNIHISDDVWIGAHVVAVDGANIGKGAVIAAGAVVNSDIPEFSLAGGVPARIIKNNYRG